MLKIIENYKKIIIEYHITQFEQFGANLRFRANITFVDHSILYVRETVINGKKRKYSYHWQKTDGTVLIRWDNAPDWDIITFPHHKHIGGQIEPSYERTLDQVLSFITIRLDQK